MQPDVLFKVVNNIALVGWILLIFFPKKKLTQRLVMVPVIPGMLAVAYLLLIASGLAVFREGGSFASLEGVKILFSKDAMLVAGWTHYLVFDLFVGSWIVRDGARFPHWKLVPALLLTFLFGPIGWGIYQIQKRVDGSKRDK